MNTDSIRVIIKAASKVIKVIKKELLPNEVKQCSG